jgi:hypothetical protein
MFDDWEQNVTPSEVEQAISASEQRSVMRVMFVLQRLGLIIIEQLPNETIIRPTSALGAALKQEMTQFIAWSDSGVPSVKQ